LVQKGDAMIQDDRDSVGYAAKGVLGSEGGR
jgi:hypothetical protein